MSWSAAVVTTLLCWRERWGRNGSSVSKETVVETARGNLAELRARHDWGYCSSGSVKRLSEPGPTAVANEAAPHQTDADAASARGPFSSGLAMAGIDWSDLDHGGLSDSVLPSSHAIRSNGQRWQGRFSTPRDHTLVSRGSPPSRKFTTWAL